MKPNAYTSWNPLCQAAADASLDIVQLLLLHGADVAIGNHLHALAESDAPGRLEVLRYLIEQGAPLNQLQDVHDSKRFAISSHSGNVSAPLHVAVRHQRMELAGVLLEAGADPDVRDGKGRTVLELAREVGGMEMVELLLSHEPATG